MKLYLSRISSFVSLDGCFFLAGIAFPFSIAISRFIIVLLIVGLLLSFLKTPATKKHLHMRPETGLLISFFLTGSLSIVLHPPFSLSDLEHFGLIIFPILFGLNYIHLQAGQFKKLLFSGFIVGNTVVGLINIGYGLIRSFKSEGNTIYFDSSVEGHRGFWNAIDHGGNYFFSIDLSTFMHPSYWSLYLAVCILILILEKNIIAFLKERKLKILLIFLFLSLIGLLSSRATFISVFVCAFCLLTIRLTSLREKSYSRSPVAAIIFLLFLFLAYAVNPRTLKMFRSMVDGSYRESPRIRSWIASGHLIENNWSLGVGQQHVKERLNHVYKKLGYEENYVNSFNAHNQFLESFVSGGLLSFLVLFMLFAHGFFLSIREKNLLLFLFLVTTLTHFLFESMLVRYHGIMFLSIFYPSLTIIKPRVVAGISERSVN